MTDLEKKICENLNVKYGVFTGNGTTAMYLVFKALNLQDKKVIFPAISCTNPVNAATFAGYEVEFCDIQLKDYTIDVTLLEKMLCTGEYGIVVPTHIYGHRYNENQIRQLCRKYNVVLFEDAAQSYYVGDMDVSIMSFGHTKVCETPLGGGIALTNDSYLAESIRIEKQKLQETQKLHKSGAQLFDEYREQYYKIVEENTDWKVRNRKLCELQMNSEKYFIFDLQDNGKIEDKIGQVNQVVDLRRKKTEIYQKYLSEKYIEKPQVDDLFRWRYTFLYNGNRDVLLKEARKQGIDISSWYYSLAGIYKNQHLPNADILERKVVNLWIDETHTIEQIEREIDILNKIMEADYAKRKY